MINWKPDVDKTCYSCFNHSTEPYPSEYGWQGGLDHFCAITSKNVNDSLTPLLKIIEGLMEDLDTDDLNYAEKQAILMANICPFYKRKCEININIIRD